jgi:hypothetical protein
MTAEQIQAMGCKARNMATNSRRMNNAFDDFLEINEFHANSA